MEENAYRGRQNSHVPDSTGTLYAWAAYGQGRPLAEHDNIILRSPCRVLPGPKQSFYFILVDDVSVGKLQPVLFDCNAFPSMLLLRRDIISLSSLFLAMWENLKISALTRD